MSDLDRLLDLHSKSVEKKSWIGLSKEHDEYKQLKEKIEKALEKAEKYDLFHSLDYWNRKVKEAGKEHKWDSMTSLDRCSNCGLKNFQFNEFAGAIPEFIKENESPRHLVLLCKNSKVILDEDLQQNQRTEQDKQNEKIVEEIRKFVNSIHGADIWYGYTLGTKLQSILGDEKNG